MNIVCSLAVAAALLLGARTARASCDEIGHIPENTVLFHGSPAALFDWREVQGWPMPPFKNPNAPDGPAWFAFTYPFSLHAGLRYLVGNNQPTLTLHKYMVKQTGGIAALICDNHQDFGQKTHLPVDNDGATAQAFCKNYEHQYNAYLIRKDRVRNEPELIVCHPSQVLKLDSSQDWHTHLDNHSKVYTVGKFDGSNQLTEAYALDLSQNDLTNFKKTK